MPELHRLQEETIGFLSAHDDLDDLPMNEKHPRPAPTSNRLLTLALSSVLCCIDLVCRGLLLIAPSFIASRWRRQSSSEEKLTRPTAYLDGLRGVAAWSVFNAHLSSILVKSSGAGFGHGGEDHELFKLPFIRLIYNGSFAVGLFFVISGFALSISPIVAMRKPTRDSATFMTKLSSTIFRRPMRLFLPSWASALIVFFLVRMDYFGAVQRRMPVYETLVAGWQQWSDWPIRQPTLLGQVYDYLWGNASMLEVMKVPDESFRSIYNAVLWTIKLEWRSSLVLYLTHAALFPMRRSMRVAILAGLITFGVAICSFDIPHFWAGFLIAEFSQLTASDSMNEGKRGILRSVVSWSVFILGGWLGSFPSWDAAGTPLYAWMLPYTPFGFQPVDRLWAGIGAALFIWGLRRIPVLVRFFSSTPIQYMGKISFSLYLVHFWLVHGLGRVIFYHVWSITGKESFLAGFTGFCIAYCLLLGSAIWVADIFWRCIDIPLVNLGYTLQKRMFTEL